MADNVPKVGQLIPETEQAFRDAIHVAVIPARALVRMSPGCHVGIHEEYLPEVVAESSEARKCIGIVDPFLKEDVEEGQRFWLFMYPNTVTSLRHAWSHSAFKARVPDDRQ